LSLSISKSFIAKKYFKNFFAKKIDCIVFLLTVKKLMNSRNENSNIASLQIYVAPKSHFGIYLYIALLED